MTKAGRVVVLGVFNADTAYTAPRLPQLGETLLGRGFALGPGGKGSNQAVAAARAGGDVHFISRLGRDEFAKMAYDLWHSAGITPHITEDPGSHTGAAFIFLEEGSGQNAIIVSPGAGGRISVADIDAQHELFSDGGVFLTQLEHPLEAAHEGLRRARAGGMRTILNPAPAADLSDELLAYVDVITPNESESEALTGQAVNDIPSAQKAAEALLARGVGAALITLGGQGAYYRDRAQEICLPARAPLAVRDTTGAGDAFNGAFAAALAEAQPIQDALDFASAAAGISVTRSGAANAMPGRDEIQAFCAEFKL